MLYFLAENLLNNVNTPDCWSSGYSLFSKAGGLKYKSRVGQIGHIVATARHRCNIYSKKAAVLPAGAMTWR